MTVARCRNRGAKFLSDAGMLLDKGTAPILLEPVSVELKLDRPGPPTMHVLDHAGRRTGQTLPLTAQHAQKGHGEAK